MLEIVSLDFFMPNQKQDKHSAISDMAKTYFKKVYASEIQVPNFGDVSHDFKATVTEEMNLELTMVTEIEIQEAGFSIGLHRAPGPDGLTGDFYQTFGNILKKT